MLLPDKAERPIGCPYRNSSRLRDILLRGGMLFRGRLCLLLSVSTHAYSWHLLSLSFSRREDGQETSNATRSGHYDHRYCYLRHRIWAWRTEWERRGIRPVHCWTSYHWSWKWDEYCDDPILGCGNLKGPQSRFPDLYGGFHRRCRSESAVGEEGYG
jgi:hypothetical protein